MAAVDFEFTGVQVTGGLKEALITATMDSDDTITVTAADANGAEVPSFKSVSAHIAATGVPVTFSYATNVLTLSTASLSEEDVVIRVLY